MHLDCGVCVVRDWRVADKSSLVRFANNRNVWRNLAHRFPHPYTDADADAWFSHLATRPRRTSWAIEVDGARGGRHWRRHPTKASGAATRTSATGSASPTGAAAS